MVNSQSIETEVLEYWEKGLNCARSTVCSILSHFGYESLCEPFDMAMIPYGGGIGERLVCGAVLGSLAGISVVLAKKGMDEEEIKEQTALWKITFKEKFYTFGCLELLKAFKNPEGEIDPDMPGRHEKCTEVVTSSVNFAKKIIDSKQ